MKQAAGIVVYRRGETGLEVLLVHPSGAYNTHKPWSIPKGEPEAGESLEATARRETFEETGVTVGALAPLGFIEYRKSRKRVHGFSAGGGAEEPRCASWEVDRAEFLPIDAARIAIHPDQRLFLDRLEEILGADANS